MAVSDVHVFHCFLTPALTQLFFQSHRLLFSHVSAGVKGENTPERKFASTGLRTGNHQVMKQTRSPLRNLGGEPSFASTGSHTHNHQVMSPTRSPPSPQGGAPRLRSSNIKVARKKMAISRALVFYEHILFRFRFLELFVSEFNCKARGFRQKSVKNPLLFHAFSDIFT